MESDKKPSGLETLNSRLLSASEIMAICITLSACSSLEEVKAVGLAVVCLGVPLIVADMLLRVTSPVVEGEDNSAN